MEWPDLHEWLMSAYPLAEVEEGEAGRLSVLHSGDPSAEYAALTQAAALVLAPTWSPILVEGEDAVNYLHRRLSQSIQTIPMGSGAQALQLGGDGRMQADQLVYRGADSVFLLAQSVFVDSVASLTEKYVINDRVELTRQWEGEAQVGLAGPAAPGVLLSLIDMPMDRAIIEQNRWVGFFTITLDGLPCRVFGDGRWSVPYYHLSIPRMAAAQLLRVLDDAVRLAEGRAAGCMAADLLRIESALPLFGLDADERTIPLEAGLHDAISTDKGCYPGQEIIARIINLGHPARCLSRLSLGEEVDVHAGAALLHEEKELGRVTSAVTWPGLGRTEALGYLNWDQRRLKEVLVSAGSGPITAQVQRTRCAGGPVAR